MPRATPRPASCSACVFQKREPSRCHRHAPGPGEEEHEFVHWPLVLPTDRCGRGAVHEAKPDAPHIVSCRDCVHWYQPDGNPVQPVTRRGRPQAWWDQSGYCTWAAPSPSTDMPRKTRWRVTHALEGCGDGEQVELEVDEDTGEVHRLEAADA